MGGGMANVFFLLSFAVMLIVVAWQIWDLELSKQTIRSPRDCCAVLVKYPHVLFFPPTTVLALHFFYDKVVLVDPTSDPAKSHLSNKPCLYNTIFDMHDAWHCLSAIVLALFAMMLL